MKKWLPALLLAILLLALTSTALAAGNINVSFTKKDGAINGGFDYELGLKLSKAHTEDLSIDVRSNDNGEILSVYIPAGETVGYCTFSTEAVTERKTMTFSIVEQEGITVGNRHTLTLYQLPKVQFYLGVNFGQLGKDMNIMVQCNNPSTVVKGNNVFTLRDTDGTVLAEKEWSNAKNRLTFKLTVDESMLGRHDLTVWLGDFEVSIDDGYATMVDVKDKVLTELEVDAPLMALGIDCGFADGKYVGILETLEKHNVKCTFFMTGYFLREYPEAAKAIYEAGHEIASHSNTHKHMKEMKPYDQYRQIFIPVEEAEELLGVTPRLFRPPYGEFNSNMTSICRGEGMEVIMWSDTFHDSTGKYTEKQIYSCATTGGNYHAGTIGLCHLDGYGQPDTLDAALTYWKEELGLQVIPISALVYASGRELPPMPAAREALVYTDEYWATWLENHYPEYAAMLAK